MESVGVNLQFYSTDNIEMSYNIFAAKMKIKSLYTQILSYYCSKGSTINLLIFKLLTLWILTD